MAVKAMNMKMDENELLDWKHVATVYNMTLTELVRDACKDYVDRLKQDPYYRLTENVAEYASEEETAEILSEIDDLSDDDLSIASVKQFTV